MMFGRSLDLKLGILHKDSLAWMDDRNQSVRHVLVKTKNSSFAILFDTLHCVIEIYQNAQHGSPSLLSLCRRTGKATLDGNHVWAHCRRFGFRLG
jgi:hypothetical protein